MSCSDKLPEYTNRCKGNDDPFQELPIYLLITCVGNPLNKHPGVFRSAHFIARKSPRKKAWLVKLAHSYMN